MDRCGLPLTDFGSLVERHTQVRLFRFRSSPVCDCVICCIIKSTISAWGQRSQKPSLSVTTYTPGNQALESKEGTQHLPNTANAEQCSFSNHLVQHCLFWRDILCWPVFIAMCSERLFHWRVVFTIEHFIRGIFMYKSSEKKMLHFH